MGMLDMAKKCDGEPIVRGIPWAGNGALDIRLGADFLEWESVDVPLVDATEHIRELRCDPVDCAPHFLLYQRKWYLASFLTRTLLYFYADVELCTSPNQREWCV